MKAFLILEDGTVFAGTSIGAKREVISEIVFNTSMTGYLETLTDPSFAGQAVCMTYPLIGNYGICYEDQESLRPWPDGFIVRELSRIPSNFRSEDTIQNYLKKYDIPGIAGIDTRALTRHLRTNGTMNGMITTNEQYDLESVLPQIKAYKAEGQIERVTREEVKVLEGNGRKVALLDFGAKDYIAKSLQARGCQVTLYPAFTKAEDILKENPEGIVLSDGPGNPNEYPAIVEEVKKLANAGVPVFGISMGHEFLALAAGAEVEHMKHGHRGGNYPVKDMESGRVYIAAQNHGYVVNTDTLKPEVGTLMYKNVNDDTNEGIEYVGKKIFSVQFAPAHDTEFLFDRFVKMMEVGE